LCFLNCLHPSFIFSTILILILTPVSIHSLEILTNASLFLFICSSSHFLPPLLFPSVPPLSSIICHSLISQRHILLLCLSSRRAACVTKSFYLSLVSFMYCLPVAEQPALPKGLIFPLIFPLPPFLFLSSQKKTQKTRPWQLRPKTAGQNNLGIKESASSPT